MAKLWNKLLGSNSGGQSLLKEGPKSDLFNDRDDDDSSSLSGRQPKKQSSKKLFVSRRLMRRTKAGDGEDGYESDASNNSDSSTRSTSSSFLRFQSRPKWRSLLSKRLVVQRKDDGTELPLKENKYSKWPLFSQIYTSQNPVGEDGDEEEESDEELLEEEFESELAPPAPLLQFNRPSSPATTQESGSSTCERSELDKALPSVPTAKTFETAASTSSDPASEVQDGNQTIKPKEKRKKKRVAANQTDDILTPLSIPLTICYSLRSAIGDGSARQRNSHALMERRSTRPNGSHLDVSHWSHRGKRSYMEDRFVIEHLGKTSTLTNTVSPITWLAVFDGHGGASCSQFCSDWLSSYVRKNEFFPDRLPLAMETAFEKLDSDFVSSGKLDGSTACACCVIGNSKVICCNAGDSRAIIVKRDGSFVPLSHDHKPGRNDETKRINDLGGRVIYWGRWRVEGVLAVSRSIGDAKLKPYVTAAPDIIEHEIEEDDLFLVIASDGVWDTMSSDLVAKFVLVNTCKIINKTLRVDDTLFRWISRQISKRARENGSSDNTSCIVAKLRSN